MSKIVNISEDKFRKALREIVAGEYANSPQDPFASQKEDDNHNQAITGNPLDDPTNYTKNIGMDIANPGM